MRTKPEKVYKMGGKTFTVTDILDKYKELHGTEIHRATIHTRMSKGFTYEELLQKKSQNTSRAVINQRMGTKVQLESERTERNDFFRLFNKGFI
jgi:hypothetical protein